MTHIAKHTPGPWQLDISPSGFAHIFSEKELVGTIGHIDMVKVKANAAFIAAAPAMYEALSMALEQLNACRLGYIDTGKVNIVYQTVKKALAQAEGR